MYEHRDFDVSEVVVAQARLLQNFAKRAGRKRGCMHSHISLAAIGVAKDLVAARLAHLDKTSTK